MLFSKGGTVTPTVAIEMPFYIQFAFALFGFFFPIKSIKMADARQADDADDGPPQPKKTKTLNRCVSSTDCQEATSK